ncbi:FadR/GntR family transcriptional regulator [Catenovulum maritimum]|uniref:GntR family transcriptional regulator n=1 Tax=Catenovulum maritimum TaxID=1513271 RepID=A0A0J8JPU7_9ALTE|nr:FadR/GntR family transcriptional regulator [Catenovulum maritimum]KMT66706.1 GntR family transcriptional regulator [Catenovulum maritimum]
MKSRRLFWSVVEKIEAGINNGSYLPGTRLPSERELSELFNVSRPTLREAIIALEVRGRVEVRTNAGVYVINQDKVDKSEVSSISAFELTQCRALVEGEAAALAASSITEDELNKLEDLVEQLDDEKLSESADREFHLMICKSTHNKALIHSIKNLWELRNQPHIKQAHSHICQQSNAQRKEEHKQIYQALKARNPEQARSAMHQHFNRLINALFEASEIQALEEIKQKSQATRQLYSLEHILS